MGKMIIKSRVGYQGQEIYGFLLPWTGDKEPKASISGNILDTERDRKLARMDGRAENGIDAVELKDGQLTVSVKPFSVSCKFELTVDGEKYTAADGDITTDWADKFVPGRRDEFIYRLYSPDCDGPRPLILFLHGGGEQGFDNYAQVYSCFGAAKLAESYPDCYVLAPQAHAEDEALAKLGRFPGNSTFATAGYSVKGWTREYLGMAADMIREMIAAGKVVPDRVYVTGMSMGGSGTIRMLSVAGDLFAAAVCICPRMTPEVYDIMRGLTHTKIWLACAYLDHIYFRHKYITDAVMELKDAGNKDARLTIFSPEQMQKYGIGVVEDETIEEIAGWNHACWVPTYCDEEGIMSWMINQKKENI